MKKDDTLRFNIDLTLSWIQAILTRLIPKEISFGENKVKFLGPSQCEFGTNTINIVSQMALDYHPMTGVAVQSNLEVISSMSLKAFPEVSYQAKRIRLLNQPSVKLASFFKVPVKRVLETQIERLRPQAEKAIEGQLNSMIREQLNDAFQTLAESFPQNISMDILSPKWTFQGNLEEGKIEMLVKANLMSREGDSKIKLAFQKREKGGVDIDLHLKSDFFKPILDSTLPGFDPDVANLDLKVASAKMKILEEFMYVVIDFEDPEQGHMTFKCVPQIREGDTGIEIRIIDLAWRGGSLVQQGLLRLFEAPIKRRITRALSFSKEQLQDMIAGYLIDLSDRKLKDIGGEVDSFSTNLLISGLRVDGNQLLVRGSLAGEVNLDFTEFEVS
ncbi:MAG: hypothetical protein HKN16_04370 [Saprospiraceae bacterium]|nr:hypothetical protein [Saprospiraceae bacterium]